MLKFKNFLVCFILFSLFIILIIFNKTAVDGALNGMVICSQKIIPSLFPFTVIAVFLYNGGYADNLISKKENGQKFIIFLISCIGGYPIGAKLISEAYNSERISSKCAENMLYSSINAGPAFCVSVIGGMVFASYKLGVIVFIASIMSSFQIFLIMGRKSDNIQNSSPKHISFADNFVYSVSSAAAAMISVCAYVIIFSSILNLVNTQIDNIIFKTFLIGSLEVTAAVNQIDNIYLICFFTGFGGLSILMQVISLTKDFKPNILKLFISRIINGLLMVFNAFVLIKAFRVNVNTISNGYLTDFSLSQGNIIFFTLFLITSVCLIYSFNCKKYSGKITKDIF